MKVAVLLSAETGREECVDVIAHSNDVCNIFIDANSMERAQALLPTGIEKAGEAMRDWTPETAPPAPVPEQKEHYITYWGKSIEQMEKDALAFEASSRGQRFIKSIENAKIFEMKHNTNPCLNVSKILYLSNKHKNRFLNALFDVFALAYRNGFRDGRKKTGGA